MKTVFALIKKDFLLFLADRVGMALTFVMPIVLIYIFGQIFGTASAPRGIGLILVNESEAPAMQKIESILDTTETFRVRKMYRDENGKELTYDSVRAKMDVKSGVAPAALIIPADAVTDTAMGVKLKLYFDPQNEFESKVTMGVLQQIIMQEIPSVLFASMNRRSENFLGKDSSDFFRQEMAGTISKYFNVDQKEALKFFEMNLDDTSAQSDQDSKEFFSELINIEQTQLTGTDKKNQGATRGVGGWAMMFLLFSITASASSLFDEKKSGVVYRILSSPVTRPHILYSKYLFNIALGVTQLTILFLTGYLLFDIDIFTNFTNLMLVIIAASVACTAFGMLLSAVSKTSAQANGLATILILLMSAIGGAWFPTSFMPSFIQLISKFTLVYWSIDGFLNVLWRDAGVLAILPHLGFLFLFAGIMITVSHFLFKRGNVF